MHDIIFISSGTEFEKQKYLEFKKRYPFVKQARTYEEAKQKSFTKLFWLVWPDVDVVPTFDFKYDVPEWDQQYVHVFKNNNLYDGICLSSKIAKVSEREFNHRFFINKKEVDIVASTPTPFEVYCLKSYDEYLLALENTSTEMFWCVWDDLVLQNDFLLTDYYIPKYDSFHRNITHIFLNGEFKDGICLFSKNQKVSEREFNHRFFINKKEVDIVASTPKKYDIFEIDSYEDYTNAISKSSTEMFWVIPKEVIPTKGFDFSLYFSHHNSYDRNMNHVFQHLLKNEITYNGIMLMSKNKTVTKKEISYRFLVEKKQQEVLASKNKPYDIVFISYNELNAEQNFQKLTEKVGRSVYRVNGVKGIHNAHKEAALLATTEMFWVVDADAVIEQSFNFDFEITRYERDIVHVWKSRNPINDLIYGYGGVKLLPRQLVLNMNMNSSDMTTSISERFKAMDDVSNITEFNTDPFSTWRSAFRECVKLASKSIEGQIDAETTERLNVWCTVANGNFSEYATAGALAGRNYGQENAGNQPALALINDFDWLKSQFEQTHQT